MMRSMFAAVLLAVPAIAVAQSAAPAPAAPAPAAEEVQDQAPQRVRSVMLTPGQKCPPANGNEIVVCSTLEEPYRIPRALRQSEPTAANRAWASRAEVADEVGRQAAGLPNTCSPTGSGGQTGCTEMLLQRWTEEMLARRNGQAIP